MDDIINTVLAAKRRKFMSSRAVFERHSGVTEAELFRIATRLNFRFALDLAKWLRKSGYGDIDQTLSFREDCFAVLGEGYVVFARDAQGNRYAFSPVDGGIYVVSSGVEARLADDFAAFMAELIRRDYQLQAWVNGLAGG